MSARIAAFVDRDIRLALSNPSTLVTPFISAIIAVAGFAYLARIVNPHAPLDAGGRHIDYFSYVALNFAFMSLLNVSLQSIPAALRRDQLAGTLESMIASPTSLITMVAGSAAWPIFFACLRVAVCILCAVFFGLRLEHVNLPLLAQFVLLGMTCTAAIGVIASAGVIAFKQSPPSTLFVGSAATLLAGVMFPVSLLPRPLQLVSWTLPLTHTLHGVRAAMSGAPFAAGAYDAAWLAGAALLLVPIAFLTLHLAIVYAKTDGSLSSY
jgi:ABC-2 type transport system permease protein